MSISQAWVAVLVALSLAGCGGGGAAAQKTFAADPLVGTHPTARLEIAGSSFPGEPGSYARRTATGMFWADSVGIPTPLDPSAVPAGLSYEVEISHGNVSSILLAWWTAELEPEPIPRMSPDRLYWYPSGNPIEVRAETIPGEPGRYLLKLIVHLLDQSVYTYAWYLDVR